MTIYYSQYLKVKVFCNVKWLNEYLFMLRFLNFVDKY